MVSTIAGGSVATNGPHAVATSGGRVAATSVTLSCAMLFDFLKDHRRLALASAFVVVASFDMWSGLWSVQVGTSHFPCVHPVPV